MIDSFLRADLAATPLNVPLLLVALSLSFVEGQLLAMTYMWTHAGLSYSRSFVGSLVVMPMLVCLVMQVLSNNLVTAFGLMAIFAIVRFRNILRDTLDTTFILSAIVLGMAAGTLKLATAAIGVVSVCAVFFFLRLSAYGTRHRYDLILNLHWGRSAEDLSGLATLLARHALRYQCATQRAQEGAEGVDLSYRLLMRDRNRTVDLLDELRRFEGVSRVSGMAAEDESEL
jgi:hypothetical protein